MKIMAISGSRADWGLLQPVLRLLSQDERFSLEILVTGQHLEPGNSSIDEIEAEGFKIDHKINMQLFQGDTDLDICRAIARVVDGVGSVIHQHRPDIMMVLGDRYEILGAVTAALLSKVPVAHIAGGDVTEGAFDDSIRHAVTKMSSLHFATTEQAASRIIQMGEMPENVIVSGSPGVDQILAKPRLDRTKFFERVGLVDKYPTFVITLHPATLSSNNISMTNEMFAALNTYPKAGLLFTGSNTDPGAAEIDELIQTYARNNENSVYHKSLGSELYFSALEYCDLLLGNSSSALYEAPSFQTPSVNIGDRQKRRIRASSVIDCNSNAQSIRRAIDLALNGDWKSVHNPYGNGHAAEKIISFLATIENPSTLIKKSFGDTCDAEEST